MATSRTTSPTTASWRSACWSRLLELLPAAPPHPPPQPPRRCYRPPSRPLSRSTCCACRTCLACSAHGSASAASLSWRAHVARCGTQSPSARAARGGARRARFGRRCLRHSDVAAWVRAGARSTCVRWQRRGRRAPPRPPARLAGVSGTARVLTVRGRAVGRGPGRLRTLHWAPLPLLPRVKAWCDEDEYCLVLQERCTRLPWPRYPPLTCALLQPLAPLRSLWHAAGVCRARGHARPTAA